MYLLFTASDLATFMSSPVQRRTSSIQAVLHPGKNFASTVLTLNLVTTRLWNTGRHVSVVVTVNYDSLKADTKMESQGRTAWQSWAS